MFRGEDRYHQLHLSLPFLCLAQVLLFPSIQPFLPFCSATVRLLTGLPTSQGNTTVITVVYHSSMMIKFLALPKLSSLKERAKLFLSTEFKDFSFQKAFWLTRSHNLWPSSGEISSSKNSHHFVLF